MVVPAEAVACEVIEVVPLVMRAIRVQMRSFHSSCLSITQFRALNYVDGNAGASLSEVAEHIGVTLPSMSKMVDGLVEQKMVSRELDGSDRRRMTLGLTARGRSLLKGSRANTQAYLAGLFEGLPAAKRDAIFQAMQTLRPIFACEQDAMAEPHQEA